jgi:hypothetical protein
MGLLERRLSAVVLAGALLTPSLTLAQQKPAAKAAPADEPPDRLSDEAELARVVSLVEAAKYDQCVTELDHLLDPKAKRPLKDPAIVETARVYQATCYVGLGKPDLADEPLREALRKNPQMSMPDSLIFPQRVIERWIVVHDSMVGELRAAEQTAIEKARKEAAERLRNDNERWARMLMLERLAREEVVITKNRRWVAAVPFGVGQFQNGNHPLGWTFFAAEAALGITSLTSLTVYTHLQAKVDDAKENGGSVEDGVNGRLSDWHLALELSTYGFLGVAALGIGEAQVSFVPEVRTVRERPLPKGLPGGAVLVLPRVAARPGGVELGVVGRF